MKKIILNKESTFFVNKLFNHFKEKGLEKKVYDDEQDFLQFAIFDEFVLLTMLNGGDPEKRLIAQKVLEETKRIYSEDHSNGWGYVIEDIKGELILRKVKK